MSHAKHRAPRRHHLPTGLAATTAGPLALAALSLVGAPAAQAMAPATGVASSTAEGVVSGDGSYVVRSGDTLASIARAHGVAGGWQALASANRIAQPNAISSGLRLVIPGASSASTASAEPVVSEASSTSSSKVVAYARTFSGIPYRWGGTSRSGVDCSGMTSLVLRHFGYSPPRTAAAQYAWTTRISASQARPGDLVFGYFSGGRAGHVGVYVGNGKMIDAPRPGKVVGEHNVPRSARYGRLPSRSS